MSVPMQELIQRIAQQRLGGAAPPPAMSGDATSPTGGGAPPPPEAMGAPPEMPPGAMPPGAPPGMPQKPPEVPPTLMEKAAVAGSPADEGDRMKDQPVMYQVPWGEETRDLTPEQIRGTFDRYSALNYKHANLKPFVELGDELMKRAPPGTDPRDITRAMVAALTKNPQMGQQREEQQQPGRGQPRPETNADLSEQLEKWEQENAVALPPGYKELMSQVSGVGGQMGQMRAMLERVLGATDGVTQAAVMGRQQNEQQAVDLKKQLIANNMREVQQTLQLPQESAQDFLVFLAERGYTPLDLADKDLAIKVASDFKANLNSPEMDRLKSIHQRRQAFTGSLGGLPGSPPSGGTPPAGGERLASMTDYALQRRGMK